MKTPVQQLTRQIRAICREHYAQGMTERRQGYSVAVWDGILAAEIRSALNTIVGECGASQRPANADFVEWVEEVTRERLEAAEEGDTEGKSKTFDEWFRQDLQHEAEQDAIANRKCPECGAALEAVDTAGLEGDELKALEGAMACNQCPGLFWLD